MSELLIKKGADIEIPGSNDFKKNPPLLIATRAWNLHIVKLLLNKGAKIDATNRRGETALMIANSLGFKNIANFLVSNGAKK